jgi:hypothetical protein
VSDRSPVVEGAAETILRNMLAQILTGKLSIQQAASSASDNIASVLNQS